MHVLVSLAAILLLAFLLNLFFKKLGFSSIIGQILAGMLLGIPVIKALLFGSEALSALDLLSTLGIVFLLFLAGLEIELKKIKETSRDSVLLALGTSLVPLTLGTVFLVSLGYDLIVAIVFGGALAVTAGGTIVGVLMEFNVCNTKLGAIFVAAGTIDDVLEVFLLSLIVMMIQGESLTQLAFLPIEIALFILVSFFLFKLMAKILPHFRLRGDSIELFSLVMILLIGLAAVSELLEIGYLLGAIFAGFLLQTSLKKVGEKREQEVINTTRLLTMAFVVPFFFATIGLNFDVGLIFTHPLFTVATVILAVGGALLGAFLTKPFSSLTFRQLYLVGWAMSSKGSVEMVIALLARKYGLLPPEIFSALVAMAIITTLAFPFLLSREIKKNPSIMGFE